MSGERESLSTAERLTTEEEVELMGRVLDEVAMERRRQERKGAEHRARGQEHWRSCADPLLPDERKLAVLLEEVGEVAHAQNEAWVGQPANLREELIHVAAVAVAWAESLTQEGRFVDGGSVTFTMGEDGWKETSRRAPGEPS